MPIRSSDPFADITPHINVERNIYITKLLEAQATGNLPILFGGALRGRSGQWRGMFAERAQDSLANFQSRRLVLEIGCHNGLVMRSMAQAFPQDLFIGLDITFKRVYQSAERAVKGGLPNVMSVLANAKGLSEIFAPQELSGVVIFFPDPWVKKREAPHRLLTLEFCQQLFSLVAPGGFIWFKTDQESYFTTASKAFVDAGFTAHEAATPFGAMDFESTFELRFRLKKQQTFATKFVKIAG